MRRKIHLESGQHLGGLQLRLQDDTPTLTVWAGDTEISVKIDAKLLHDIGHFSRQCFAWRMNPEAPRPEPINAACGVVRHD